MKSSSFWSHFEERVKDQLQCSSTVSSGTRTITEAREEDDQDISSHCCGAIVDPALFGTMTITNTREHMDQDPHGNRFNAIPVRDQAGTKTVTKAGREEADQDVNSPGYQAIPIDQEYQ